jgi:hypothetical protein
MGRCACILAALLLAAGAAPGQTEAVPAPPPRAEIVVPEEKPEVVEGGTPPDGAAEPAPSTRGLDGLPDDPSRPVTVRIVSPRSREIIPTTLVDVFLEVENYTLKPEGNRLHVIVDNLPPVPWTDPRRPFPLKNITEGGHTVRVLAVRPDGTALRDPGAFAMVHFYVKRKDFQNYTDPQLPFLTVNLPHTGTAVLDANGRLCFDYWVHNVDFANGDSVRVHYQLDAYEGQLAEQGPVYWSNLQPGRHKLVVEMFDKSGQPVFGSFNRVEREFEVRQVLRAVPIIPENEAGNPQLVPQ